MADPADRASALETAEREAALAAFRDREIPISAKECRDCGEDIPQARRDAVKTDLCCTCAAQAEQKRRGR